ncbi:Uu.00g041290.m01.CDS01 [Anthostomella pinea]|uniref:Uu.00g041290.m01.CDS01 n=1 Tax=Anthostomella pinea TaxID=933095 RepID=A0AAI8VAD4_9PEZI|nr:Uu.00g041290.m01.CDS01 [Anthostomella pinea]
MNAGGSDDSFEELHFDKRAAANNIAALADEARFHFARLADRRFEFESIPGYGAFSVAFRIIHRPAVGPAIRLAVKRAQGEDTQGRPPYRRVRRIQRRRAAWPPTYGRVTSWGTQEQERTPAYLEGLDGPVLVMEYLENHDLQRLFTRAVKLDEDGVDNTASRYVVVRASVALAYPPNAPSGAPKQLETIERGREQELWNHGDLHMGNVLVGDTGDGFGEHDLIPPLKFIDFGNIHEVPVEYGNYNLRDSAKVIYTLIKGKKGTGDKELDDEVTHQGFKTRASKIVPAPDGSNTNINYPTLDPELRDLVARCFVKDPVEMPSLEEVLTAAERGAQKPAASYRYLGNEAAEGDEAIGMLNNSNGPGMLTAENLASLPSPVEVVSSWQAQAGSGVGSPPSAQSGVQSGVTSDAVLPSPVSQGTPRYPNTVAGDIAQAIATAMPTPPATGVKTGTKRPEKRSWKFFGDAEAED